MSMTICHKCGDVYDSDFQMETDDDDNMICDKCFEEANEKPVLKRFRASIYLDVNAENENEAYEIGRKVAAYLGNPEENELPGRYCNPYVGGVGEIVPGNLIQTNKNLEHI